jgi:predicted Rossmann fold nucleotide-binding protein DprA/Smf involved in DNA uptake
LHEGAVPVRGAQDVLDALGIFDQQAQPRRKAGGTRAALTRTPLGGGTGLAGVPAARSEEPVARTAKPASPIDAKVLAAVTGRPLCLDEIVERSGLPVKAVVVALERLEERGALREEAGWWARARNPR